MTPYSDIDAQISQYFASTTEATISLYRKHLYGHLLVVIYSTIDTLGFLDAGPDCTVASGQTFKSWTKKYLLSQPGVEFNEIDLWGARCAVLHTFTTKSTLSKSGNAREIVYFGGDKTTGHFARFVSFAKALDDGRHLPIHFQDFYLAFLKALHSFEPDLRAKCCSDRSREKRLREVLQVFSLQQEL